MNITVVGLGLIGGSMAMIAKASGFADRIIGVDANWEHAQAALDLGIADELMSLPDAVAASDVIILSIPVHGILNLLPQVLDLMRSDQVVLDTGSTKAKITASVKHHFNRKRYVATHPMWGTEYSGPKAATLNSFRGLVNVICDAQESASDALSVAEKFYEILGMNSLFMDADVHDMHVAYVSHMAHISSFALANTVLAKEQEASKIFELASGGFERTVRLAKSNPEMWVNILMHNKKHVLEVLSEHIDQLLAFQNGIQNEDWQALTNLMKQANQIKKVLRES